MFVWQRHKDFPYSQVSLKSPDVKPFMSVSEADSASDMNLLGEVFVERPVFIVKEAANLFTG